VKWGAPYCITVINHSIAHNWQSLYEPKEDRNGSASSTHKPRIRADIEIDLRRALSDRDDAEEFGRDIGPACEKIVKLKKELEAFSG
jgi:hypothetical protein